MTHPKSDEDILLIEDLGDYRFVLQTDGATYDDSTNVMKALAAMHGEH